MKIKCIIVDDDPAALAVLENYVKKIPVLDLLAHCENALEAIAFLGNNKVDLIILDIEMPHLTGIDFLKTLAHPPKAIITSANKEYALEGFELNVLDYLLKPITFERLLRAVNRFPSPEAEPKPASGADEQDCIYVKENKKIVKIYIKDILYIESLKDYIKIHLAGKSVVTRQTLSSIEAALPDGKFLRIHKSFIVSLEKIDAYTAVSIEIAKKELPVGRQYKEQVHQKLGISISGQED